MANLPDETPSQRGHRLWRERQKIRPHALRLRKLEGLDDAVTRRLVAGAEAYHDSLIAALCPDGPAHLSPQRASVLAAVVETWTLRQALALAIFQQPSNPVVLREFTTRHATQVKTELALLKELGLERASLPVSGMSIIQEAIELGRSQEG